MTRGVGWPVLTIVLVLVVSPLALAQQVGVVPAPGRASAPRQAPPVTPQGFSVVLVLGDLENATPSDDVPAAARKALTDMRDFLPYKSYKLLDAAWTLCCSGQRVVNRLRGPDEQEYELELMATPIPADGNRSSVRFTLREAHTDLVYADRPPEGERASRTAVQRDIETLEMQLAEARRAKPVDTSRVATLEERLRDLRASANVRRDVRTPKAGPVRVLMDTTFTMDLGETVVVGTSRLRGNSRALIALLTAVPPKNMRTRDESR